MSLQNIPTLMSASADASRDGNQGEVANGQHVMREEQCALHWFTGWSPLQKEDFLKFLLDRATPQNMDCLFHAMNSMNVKDKPMSIFQCQLKLLGDWVADWTDAELNHFIYNLRVIDPVFVARFREESDRAMQALQQ